MLVVETGAIVPGADAFVGLSACDLYHDRRGNDAWFTVGDSTARREAAIRRATAFLDSRYRGRWKGRRVDRDQPLSWPRAGVVDEDGFRVLADVVPARVVDATCELALRALLVGPEGSLRPDAAGATGGGAASGRVLTGLKIGPIDLSYAGGAAAAAATAAAQQQASRSPYPMVDDLLRGLLRPTGAVRLVRGY